MDKIGRKPPKKIFLRATKDIKCGRGISSFLSKRTQSWICARQLGRQDIANSSLNPRECSPCSWQANAVFAAGRQQLHPLPSCRLSFLQSFKAVSGWNVAVAQVIIEGWQRNLPCWVRALSYNYSSQFFSKLIPVCKAFSNSKKIAL